MDDFPIAPPIIVKDTPKPRRLTTLQEARDHVDEAMRLGRPAPWREVWHRLKTLAGEDEAIEAMGDLRELLDEEDLLLPDDGTRQTREIPPIINLRASRPIPWYNTLHHV
jgi:hypothetical protein